LSASIEEEKTVLRVTNPYPGKGLPLRGSGTQLALDLATEEVGAALTGRDAVNCQFYPDKRQHRWFTVLTLPGVMMQERI
jgi:hypothetical protein